jgi:hypothetical protein
VLQVVKIWSFGPLSFACNKQKSYRTICHPKLQNEVGIPVLQQWPRRAKVALLPPKIGRAPSGQSLSFDPATDDPREYVDKVKFIHSICPAKDKPMLAPRLVMLMKGTA